MPTASRTTKRSSRFTLPQRIATDRLVLRPWRRTDAPLLKAAIDANLEHLRAWMAWAATEPSPIEAIERRIDRFDQSFRAESEWGYAIFSEGEKMLYGGAGVHRSTEPGALEIRFWLGQGWMGKGFATEAVKALANVAIGLPGVERVQIRCDTRNPPSVAVARRAGFRHVATREKDPGKPGATPRDTQVWELSRVPQAPETAPARRGFWARIRAFFGGRG